MDSVTNDPVIPVETDERRNIRALKFDDVQGLICT